MVMRRNIDTKVLITRVMSGEKEGDDSVYKGG